MADERRREERRTVAVPVWYFDELAHAGAEHLDDAYVARYERKAGYDPKPDIARLRALGLDANSTVVDLGAGTGAFALAVAPYVRRVVAADVSAPMTAALEARAAKLDRSNVECVRAGFLTYAHQGEPADVVFSRHALHHLPDFWKAVALVRVARMLRPGGSFYVRDLMYSVEPGDADRALESWFDGASPTPELGWTRAELETHAREEHSTFTWLFEPMLVRAGLEIRERELSQSGIYAAYVCAKAA